MSVQEMSDEAFVAAIAMHGKPLSLFLGSGPSTGAGIPSWPTLLNSAHGGWPDLPKIGPANELPPGVGDFYDYAQCMVHLAGNRDIAVAALKSHVARAIEQAQEGANLDGYRRIARMRPKHVLSLNYDNLMCRCLDEYGRWRVRYRGAEIHDNQADDHLYIALHGNVNDPRNMVLTSDDVRGLFRGQLDVERYAAEIYNAAPVLHIGLGFQDMAFFDRLNNSNLHRQGAPISHFAIVTTEVPPLRCALLANQWGFQIIRRKIADIPPLLDKIAAAWDAQRELELRREGERLIALNAEAVKSAHPRYACNFPRPAAHVVDGKGIVDSVHAYLLQPDPVIAALVGPTGSGKTTLAQRVAKLAHKNEDRFPGGVRWLKSEGRIEDMITDILSANHVPASLRDVPEKGGEELGRTKPLFVIDDIVFEHFPVICQLLSTWLRHSPVLLLSQDRRLSEVLQEIREWKIEPLDEDEARNLFLRAHGGDAAKLTCGSEGAALTELLCGDHFFGGNPGPITIAARHMAYNHMRVAHYRDLLGERLPDVNRPTNAAELLSVPDGNGDWSSDAQKRQSYFVALDMSMQGVFADEVEAARLAVALAVEYAQDQALEPQAALAEYLAARREDGALPDVPLSPGKMAEVFRKLGHVWLVQPAQEGYVVPHPLRLYAKQKSEEVPDWRRITRNRLISRSKASGSGADLAREDRLYAEWQDFDCDAGDSEAMAAAASQALNFAFKCRSNGRIRRAYHVARKATDLFEKLGNAPRAANAYGLALALATRLGNRPERNAVAETLRLYELSGADDENRRYIAYILARNVLDRSAEEAAPLAFELLHEARRLQSSFIEAAAWEVLKKIAMTIGDAAFERICLNNEVQCDANIDNLLNPVRLLNFAISSRDGSVSECCRAVEDTLSAKADEMPITFRLEAEGALLEVRVLQNPEDEHLEQLFRDFEARCRQLLLSDDQKAQEAWRDTAMGSALRKLADLRQARSLLCADWQGAVAAAQQWIDLSVDPDSVGTWITRGWLALAQLLARPDDAVALADLHDVRDELRRRQFRLDHLKLEVGEAVADLVRRSPVEAFNHLLQVRATVAALGYATRLEDRLVADWSREYGLDPAQFEAEVLTGRDRRLEGFPPLRPVLPAFLYHPLDGRRMVLVRREDDLPYYMDEAPVTFAQYETFLRESGFMRPLGWTSDWPTPEMGAEPVRGINVDEARAYAQWRGLSLPRPVEFAHLTGKEDGATFALGDEIPELDPARTGEPIFSSAESCAEMIRGLSGSLSLDRAEKWRVIEAAVTLSQFQIDSLIENWSDEVKGFEELWEEHPEDVRRLRRQNAVVNATLTGFLKSRYRDMPPTAAFVDAPLDMGWEAAVGLVENAPFPMPALYCVAGLHALGQSPAQTLADAPADKAGWHLARLREIVHDNAQRPALEMAHPHIRALHAIRGHDFDALAILFLFLRKFQTASWIHDAFAHNAHYSEVFGVARVGVDIDSVVADIAAQAGFPDPLRPVGSNVGDEGDLMFPLRRQAARVILRRDLPEPQRAVLLYGLLLRSAA